MFMNNGMNGSAQFQEAPARREPSPNRRPNRSPARRFLPLGKSGPVWAALHFLKYGLPYRIGSRPASDESNQINRVNLMAVEHCTHTCKNCSTSAPLFAGKRFHAASAFFPWLDLLTRERIEFKKISITGGEPFLHPDIGAFLDEVKARYPAKEIGLTTNFFWASENKIRTVTPKLKSLDRLVISRYPNTMAKLGGKSGFHSLVNLVRELCPHLEVSVSDGSHMISWELHAEKETPKAYCCTSDCYVLRPNGKISHCSIAAGLDNRPEYADIVKQCKEGIFDLRHGTSGFLPWIRKYPFDLCYHCTLWKGVREEWQATQKNVVTQAANQETTAQAV